MSQIVQHAKQGKLPNSRFLKVGNAKYRVHHICWTVGKSRNSTGKIHAVQMNAHVVFMCGNDKVATLRHGTITATDGRKINLGKKKKLDALSGASRKAIEAVADTFVEDVDHPEQDINVFCMDTGSHLTLLSPEHQGTVKLSHDFVEGLRQNDGHNYNEPVKTQTAEHSEEVTFAVRDMQPPRRGQRVVGHKTKPIHSTQKVQYAQSPRNPVVEQSEHWRLEDGRWVTETRTFVDGIEQYPMPAIGDRPDTIMSRAFRERFCTTPAEVGA